MNHDRLLQQFGQRVGAKNMEFNLQRSCTLNFEDRYLITLNEVNEETLLLSAIIGQLPEEEANRSALELLSLNMEFASIGGPYVSYEPTNRALLLASPLFSEGLDVIALEEQIKYLIQNIDHIYESLRERDIVLQEEDNYGF